MSDSDYEWFKIPGRGYALSFDKDQIPEGMWDLSVLNGQVVEVNGLCYTVKGVGTFKPMISPENPYRYPFELILEEYNE